MNIITRQQCLTEAEDVGGLQYTGTGAQHDKSGLLYVWHLFPDQGAAKVQSELALQA